MRLAWKGFILQRFLRLLQSAPSPPFQRPYRWRSRIICHHFPHCVAFGAEVWQRPLRHEGFDAARVSKLGLPAMLAFGSSAATTMHRKRCEFKALLDTTVMVAWFNHGGLLVT
jgi:hypothetical protein